MLDPLVSTAVQSEAKAEMTMVLSQTASFVPNSPPQSSRMPQVFFTKMLSMISTQTI